MWRHLFPIALCSLASSAAAAIFDADDRQTIDPPFPLTSVGVVTGGENIAYGSGFLIDPCTVLSARHVAGDLLDPVGRRLLFTAGRRSSHGRVISAGPYQRFADARRAVHSDWLVIRLDKCLGLTLGYLTLGRLADSVQVETAGYPRDRPLSKITLDKSCVVKFVRNGELYHDCATLPGDSGGPMLQEGRDGLVAIGINAAGYDWSRSVKFNASEANVAIATADLLETLCPLLAVDSNPGCGKRALPSVLASR